MATRTSIDSEIVGVTLSLSKYIQVGSLSTTNAVYCISPAGVWSALDQYGDEKVTSSGLMVTDRFQTVLSLSTSQGFSELVLYHQ